MIICIKLRIAGGGLDRLSDDTEICSGEYYIV
jgi:hypothetical protein